MAHILNLTGKAEALKRLRLLYVLHLTPLFDTNFDTPTVHTFDQTEIARDASEFFESVETIHADIDSLTIGDNREGQKCHKKCASVNEVLVAYKEAVLSEATSIHLPSINQSHFIAMWRTFYDIFIGTKLEQDAYHGIAKVGTLLISLGDVSKTNRPKPKSVSATGNESPPSLPSSSSITRTSNKDKCFESKPARPSTLPIKERMNEDTEEWRITFEQFLASILTQPVLDNYFNAKIDLKSLIEKYKDRRLLRQTTLSSSPE